MTVISSPRITVATALLYFFATALGIATSQCGFDVAQQRVIANFLDSGESGGGKFHVQGWRWHTMSLVRESDRLHKLARTLEESCQLDDLPALKKAVDYVVGFNMKGLHRIESDLFFPWVRKMTTVFPDAGVAGALGAVMDQLEHDRRMIEILGDSLVRFMLKTAGCFVMSSTVPY
jgi:hypothetical protein